MGVLMEDVEVWVKGGVHIWNGVGECAGVSGVHGASWEGVIGLALSWSWTGGAGLAPAGRQGGAWLLHRVEAWT